MSDKEEIPNCKNRSSRKSIIQTNPLEVDYKETTIIGERKAIDETVNTEQRLPTTNLIIIGKGNDSCQSSEYELKIVSKQTWALTIWYIDTISYIMLRMF